MTGSRSNLCVWSSEMPGLERNVVGTGPEMAFKARSSGVTSTQSLWYSLWPWEVGQVEGRRSWGKTERNGVSGGCVSLLELLRQITADLAA